MSYSLDLSSEEFSLLTALLDGDFKRWRCNLLRGRMSKGDKQFFENSFMPFFNKVESIRLKRSVRYDVKTGEHFDVV